MLLSKLKLLIVFSAALGIQNLAQGLPSSQEINGDFSLQEARAYCVSTGYECNYGSDCCNGACYFYDGANRCN